MVKNIRVYPAKKYTGFGFWLRRTFLGHYALYGKDLKKILPKGSTDKRIIKNKVLYGVAVKHK